jgi:hypothetical protein
MSEAGRRGRGRRRSHPCPAAGSATARAMLAVRDRVSKAHAFHVVSLALGAGYGRKRCFADRQCAPARPTNALVLDSRGTCARDIATPNRQVVLRPVPVSDTGRPGARPSR